MDVDLLANEGTMLKKKIHEIVLPKTYKVQHPNT